MPLRRKSDENPDSRDDRDEWLIDVEHSKVETWRLHVLSEAGYPIGIAQRLAMTAAVDLHVACDILRRGCSPERAADILL